MSDAKLALDELRKGLRIFRAFEHAEGVIAQVQSADQRVAEAQLALAALQPQVDSAKQLVADSTRAAQAAVDAARAATAEAKVVADGIVSAAQAKADAVKAKADTYFETTKKGVEEMVNKAQASFDERIARRDALEDETNDLEARVEKANAYIAKIKE
jgi:hypothetical protein